MEGDLALKNIVLFFCGSRTGHFGQGTFTHSLLPYFKTRLDTSITLIKTDCDNVLGLSSYQEDDMHIIAIPHLQNTPILTGENSHFQKAHAQRIINIIYPQLKDKPNLLFWVNSIDYLNVCYDLRQVFKECKIMYVHHSFSWKYFLNVSDEVFSKQWKKDYNSFHPKAFEMTKYQQEMALISDITVTVTKHAKIFFESVLIIPPHKIITIYNGRALPTKNQLGKQELRKKYGFKKTEKIILFSGRITEDKGFPNILRAFKIVTDNNPNVKLVVMGAGRVFEFISLIEPHWNKIVFTGELKQEQVSDFYQLADVGVIPSLHEQCSFTAIEMRLHKLPIIISGVDGSDEMFTHEYDSLKLHVTTNNNGVKVLDDKELADYINRLLMDRKLSNFLVKNSYRKGLEMFTDERMWEGYGNVLNNIFSN